MLLNIHPNSARFKIMNKKMKIAISGLMLLAILLSTGCNQKKEIIRGAGATFPLPLYEKMLNEFKTEKDTSFGNRRYNIFLISVIYLSIRISLLRLTLLGIFVLILSFCIWIFVFYLVLGLRKSEKYLSKVEKWDSPKALGLILIIVWTIFAVLYYIKPIISTLLIPVGVTMGSLMGAYMRNTYRKELKT